MIKKVITTKTYHIKFFPNSPIKFTWVYSKELEKLTDKTQVILTIVFVVIESFQKMKT